MTEPKPPSGQGPDAHDPHHQHDEYDDQPPQYPSTYPPPAPPAFASAPPPPPAALDPFRAAAPPTTPFPTADRHTDGPAAPTSPSESASARRPRRLGLAAGVVAASLVVGGGAGVGGAAAWNALADDEPGTGGSGGVTTSQVVDTPETPAADGTIEQVAAKVLPSVVKIDVAGGQGAGSGSGIVLSSDGVILTNEHVVAVAGDGGTIRVSFNDGSSATATVVGTDPLTDTAVIKADDVSGLTPAAIGKSGDLRVGQEVVAIGSPFGLESTVTSGIVSALDRPVDVGSDNEGNSTTYPAIQTDAAINPGNSGGPLVDLDGNVVGINSSIRTASSGMSQEGGSIGLGFAIPIDEVLPIVDQMREGETPTHARLGVTVSDVGVRPGQGPGQEQGPDQGAEVLAQGAQIQEVGDGSTAAESGLEAGDVITKIDDRVITGADSLVATIRSYRPGDTVTVTYVRDGETSTTELTLDSDADRAAS
ncbi:S1C family serine protease [Nocardioides sp. SYSU D00038]|uniref:S1C family serine protease n=1 Tax=Nocardioides sp. SYSU D00038 TaxID=2812554 RepID=UPI0019673B78|nr:trypsin-like peptidase domain-containing protein [Nocardioides sp. SYSU D00038]